MPNSDDFVAVLDSAGFDVHKTGSHAYGSPRLSNDLVCETDVSVIFDDEREREKIVAKIAATCL